MEYRHTQWSKVTPALFFLFGLTMLAIIGADDEVSTGLVVAVGVFLAFVLGVILLFSRLEVVVGERRLVASFGFGWPKKVIEHADVSAVRALRNPWWYGWGVRKVPRGWMYNVWGLDAVELDLPDGKAFRIGTDEPHALLTVLSLHVSS